MFGFMNYQLYQDMVSGKYLPDIVKTTMSLCESVERVQKQMRERIPGLMEAYSDLTHSVMGRLPAQWQILESSAKSAQGQFVNSLLQLADSLKEAKTGKWRFKPYTFGKDYQQLRDLFQAASEFREALEREDRNEAVEVVQKHLKIKIQYVYRDIRKYLKVEKPSREQAVNELIWAAMEAFQELRKLNCGQLMALKKPLQEFKQAFNRRLYESLTGQQKASTESAPYEDEVWYDSQSRHYEDWHLKRRDYWIQLEAGFEAALAELYRRKSNRALKACQAIEAILDRECLDDDEIRKRFGPEVWRTIKETMEKMAPHLVLLVT